MIAYPHIDPEIIRIGPVAVRWYGVMYLIGFAASYLLVNRRIRKEKLDLDGAFIESLYTFVIFGLVIGARLGYVIFYDLPAYRLHPLDVIAVWKGGMSFHGGLIGGLAAGFWCCRKNGRDPWLVGDLVSATAPIGLGAGRIGNFINGELFGRATNVPWGMVFPSGGPLPRHPSQIYEFLLEGVLLFTILRLTQQRTERRGLVLSVFIILYGTIRFIVEFFREPDPQLGFIAGSFTMGQALSSCMIIGGFILAIWRWRARQ